MFSDGNSRGSSFHLLVSFFFPARSKCYSVLGTIQPYPGTPPRVPAVFVPGTRRSESTMNCHDDLCQWSACFGKLTGLDVLLPASIQPPLSCIYCVSPPPCVKVITSAHKGLASFLGFWEERRMGKEWLSEVFPGGPLSKGQQWHLLFVLSLLNFPQAWMCVILPDTSRISQDVVSVWNNSLGWSHATLEPLGKHPINLIIIILGEALKSS